MDIKIIITLQLPSFNILRRKSADVFLQVLLLIKAFAIAPGQCTLKTSSYYKPYSIVLGFLSIPKKNLD